jgi:hypothetical protein
MKILKIKKWENHIWYKQGFVSEVEVVFLKSIANSKSTDYTDMPDGSIFHQEIIFDSIEKDGMEDPLVIVISVLNKTIRLESGNHRVKIAVNRGYTHLPCTLVIFEKGILLEGNGNHLFKVGSNILDRISSFLHNRATYPVYLNPKDILKDYTL